MQSVHPHPRTTRARPGTNGCGGGGFPARSDGYSGPFTLNGGGPMFEKLTTAEEIYSFKPGAALTMERTTLEML
ncbi:MAG TPA: hypothetical protein VJN72_14030, partial [Gaiellales bacterium]|nr:hypothetical protein [Gaiellales bacterium]